VHIKKEEGESRLKRPRGRPPKLSREHSSIYDNPRKNKYGKHQVKHCLTNVYTCTPPKCFRGCTLHNFCIFFEPWMQNRLPLMFMQIHSCTCTHLAYCSPLSAAPRGTHLWEFIRDILIHPEKNEGLMKWEDRREGVFKFLKSEAVAQMWGQKKKNSSMTYEKLSRAMRWVHAAANRKNVHVKITALICNCLSNKSVFIKKWSRVHWSKG